MNSRSHTFTDTVSHLPTPLRHSSFKLKNSWPPSGVSKLALTLFSNSLQRNISPNIVCISLHPGLVHTSIANHLRFARLLNFLLWIFAKTPENGCYTTLFAAASPKVKAEPEKYKARYLVPDGVIQAPNPNALKLELQDELWETTERYLVDIGINQ